MLMGHLQVSSNLHDPMGRARFPGEAQTGKLHLAGLGWYLGSFTVENEICKIAILRKQGVYFQCRAEIRKQFCLLCINVITF